MQNKKKLLIVGSAIMVLILAVVVGIFINKGTSNNNDEETTTVEQSTGLDKSVYMDPTKDVETRVEALLSQMTLEEKVAQMLQAEQLDITLNEITKYGIGSILSGGGSAPPTGNSAEDWQKHINGMKQAALEARLGIPLLYGVDAVHGHSNIDAATIFPHNIGLGSANDVELMESMGQIVAEEVKATGIQWTFAPTLANPQNELWGRTYEGFGEDADLVASLGEAFIKGAQGELSSDGFLSPTNVIATAKHYIGEGYTMSGTNQGDVVMDADEFEALLDDELLKPYKAAVDAGVRTVMVSFNSVNGLKCHENAYLVNEVLKGELGFTGLVVGDYNGVQQVSGIDYKAQIANAVNAGVDLLMEPYSWREVYDLILKNVEDGSISQERIDDAVTRILRVKFEAGLFEEEIASETEEGLMAEFGSAEHREVARDAVRKSLVLLKNDKVNEKTAMQALADSKDILVIGQKADNIGVQCGGWTIAWQGSYGDIIEGTTILEGLQNAAGDRTITHQTSVMIETEPEAIIVVAGENPYAETEGDRSSSSLTVANSDVGMLNNLADSVKAARDKGIPVILLLLTGRPVTIADYVDQYDAIVEAWLPGTEGDGVADVLLGDYDFTGTLTYTWPWYATDIDTKFDDPSKVLFANGTGLKKDGTSIKAEGTAVIGTKPELSEDDQEAMASGSIDLESTNYIVEAENYADGSYLVTKGNENNISFVENWGGAWANAKWKVWVPKAGKYKLHFYIAAAKDTSSVEIYYASPFIEDDGNANKTPVPMTTTTDMMDYQDFTLDVELSEGNYEFKFMNGIEGGADFRLDRIEFEYLSE